MSNDLKEHWETAHQNNNILWLSGYDWNTIWNNMNIANKLTQNMSVLVIGVGMGHETTELSKRNLAALDVLDISESAISKVKGITRSQYLASDVSTLPSNEYDIVSSHLVNQHMSDQDFDIQCRHVIRSLKPEGIFAMQFAFVEHLDCLPAADLTNQTDGGCVRKLHIIENFVKNNGGFISWASDIVHFPHTIAKWQYVHIQRAPKHNL